MENVWYYASNDKKKGPYSPRQLKDLANAGTILRTDTVWKGGVEKGVSADRVKNLFAPIAFVAPLTPAMPIAPALPMFDNVETPRLVPLVPFVDMQTTVALAALNSAAAPAPVIEAPASTPKPAAVERPKQPPKGRATAVCGAIIVSQDGARAKYRMVCKPCGHQDSSCQSLTITNKTYKRNFFCPKCRKRRDVSIQCQTR